MRKICCGIFEICQIEVKKFIVLGKFSSAPLNCPEIRGSLQIPRTLLHSAFAVGVGRISLPLPKSLLEADFAVVRPSQAEKFLGFFSLFEENLCRFCTQKNFHAPPKLSSKKNNPTGRSFRTLKINKFDKKNFHVVNYWVF